MLEVKEYSSLFATKVAYVLNNFLKINEHGLIHSISAITHEKESTTKNWLFNNRVPRDPKRLAISDSLGISEDYLFNDSIAINDVKKPEITKKDGCYWIPSLNIDELFKIKTASIFPIKNRIPLMLPFFDQIVKTYGNNIYATKIEQSNFQPYIEDNSTLICSDNIQFEEYKFLLIKNKSQPLLKRFILSEGQRKLLFLDGAEEKEEPFMLNEDMLLVILSFSL